MGMDVGTGRYANNHQQKDGNPKNGEKASVKNSTIQNGGMSRTLQRGVFIYDIITSGMYVRCGGASAHICLMNRRDMWEK